MKVTVALEQDLGNIGEQPILFHGADNAARIVSRINGTFRIRACPTPQGDWTDVVIGDQVEYERNAASPGHLSLAYESGVNGVFVYPTESDPETVESAEVIGRHVEMALLLDEVLSEFFADTVRHTFFAWEWEWKPDPAAASWACKPDPATAPWDCKPDPATAPWACKTDPATAPWADKTDPQQSDWGEASDPVGHAVPTIIPPKTPEMLAEHNTEPEE